MLTNFLIPDWPAPPGVRALCTTRAGGVSLPPYDSLNLGDHVGDAPLAVRANRQTLRNALGSAQPVFLRQVHGMDVLHAHAGAADGAVADASATSAPGVACTVMVADCLPVLLAHQSGAVVAAAHAGWRGMAGLPPGDGLMPPAPGGVLAAVFKVFCALTHASTAQSAMKTIAKETIAWLGPCIGPQAFEVGGEVRAAFVARHAQAARHFEPCGHGKYLAHLPALARDQLHALGITAIYGNDGSAPWCTVANPSRFFSHRRDGISGRLAACIWRG